MIRKITCLILLLIASTFSYGQTTLSPGDIAITGFNSDDGSETVGTGFLRFRVTTTENEFTFVLLKDVEINTTIRFTDNGWKNDDTFRAEEGVIIWTAAESLTCGSEITISTGFWVDYIFIFETGRSDFYTASTGSIDTSLFANFELGGTGDQILAYQGTETSPSFVFAINFNGGNWRFGGANSDATSAIPLGLTRDINAANVVEKDNGNYDCAVTSGTAFILEAICDKSNWNMSDSRLTLGGCGYSCGDCGDTVTWNGSSWSPSAPDATNEVIIDGDYNTGVDGVLDGNIIACSLTINVGATLTIDNESYLEIEHDVIINGNLVVETQGNFVQRGAGTSAGTFTGIATVNKTTPSKAKWYHYTYWSSPVVGETIGNVFPLVDGDRRYYFDATKFVDKDLPLDDVDDNGDDWQPALGAMAAGTGYAVTGIRSSTYPAVDNVTFSGAFNTGDKIVDITFNSNNDGIRWNFIGNPYPSAIDFDAFHADNLAIIEGVAYFWSQASPPLATNPGNEQLNFNQDDYAVYNIGSGGVATRPGGAGVTPNGNVASTQGFFIPAITAGTVTFTNDMRETDAASNSQFFKGASSKKSNRTNALDNKLWVNLTTNNGVFNQILVAYVDGATNHKDAMAYDAPKLLVPGFAAALYTNIDGDSGKYIIQGKDSNSINEDEIIKLGFKTSITVATLYKLSIDHLEGEFLNNTTIFIKDNVLNTVHNLTDSDYSFTSEVGEFNERFEIIFKEDALSTDHNNLENNTLRIVELYNDEFLFKTSDALTIKTIAVFDLLGRQLYDLKGHQSSETFRISNLSNAAYVVKVQLSNGAVITKKIIKK